MFELREITQNDKTAYNNYIKEWQAHHESIVPTIMDPSINNFETLFDQLKKDKHPTDHTKVPATMLFYFRDKRILGTVHIRHELNENLKTFGGHVGYGVAPEERGKGYATQILGGALNFLETLGVKDALITCDDDNLSSIKVIKNHNGVESKSHTREDGILTRRFWIPIKID